MMTPPSSVSWNCKSPFPQFAGIPVLGNLPHAPFSWAIQPSQQLSSACSTQALTGATRVLRLALWSAAASA